ncbi:YIP1 family protein [Saliphagus infecundisoli]|uniref:YIP1 family protein n=1 Tax=Saliphagus infecundisoli TaxID=1849069 RepID=A0ABD5QFB1_9EURY|nr:YIP1 family protein [Saliphagus infecundisoli]
MTTWIEEPEGGRERGPRAIARAWLEVLVRPRRFFEAGVAPGDQAPGLVFFVVVVFCAEATRYALEPGAYPDLGVAPALAAAFWLGLVVLLVAPLALHAIAAIQTLCLMVLVPDRAGISQTVQVIGYAAAPCALAGVPVPALRLLCTTWGAALLVLGLVVIHDTSRIRAALAGAIPATLLFGYGFRGFAAAGDLGIGVAL